MALPKRNERRSFTSRGTTTGAVISHPSGSTLMSTLSSLKFRLCFSGPSLILRSFRTVPSVGFGDLHGEVECAEQCAVSAQPGGIVGHVMGQHDMACSLGLYAPDRVDERAHVFGRILVAAEQGRRHRIDGQHRHGQTEIVLPAFDRVEDTRHRVAPVREVDWAAHDDEGDVDQFRSDHEGQRPALDDLMPLQREIERNALFDPPPEPRFSRCHMHQQVADQHRFPGTRFAVVATELVRRMQPFDCHCLSLSR